MQRAVTYRLTGPQSERLAAIRGVAALMVAVAHAIQIYLYPLITDAHPVARASGLAAAYAVGAFFFVSGHVIAFSILSRIVDGRFAVLDYARARAARILPPFLASVAITAAVALVINGLGLYGSEGFKLPGDATAVRERATVSLREVLWTLTLSFNLFPGYGTQLTLNGPLWSLSYEVWLYAIAGLAVMFVVNGSWMALLLALMLLVLPSLNNHIFAMFAIVWGAGFASGWLTRFLVPRVARALGWIGAAMAAGVVALLAAKGAAGLLLTPYGTTAAKAAFVACNLSLGAVLIAYWRRPTVASGPTLVAARAGDVSYTVYVLHFPLLILSYALLRPLGDPHDIATALATGAVGLVAVVTLCWVIGRRIENCWRSAVRQPAIAVA